MDWIKLIVSICVRLVLLLLDLLNEDKVTFDEEVNVGIVKSRKIGVKTFILRSLVSAPRKHSSIIE